jgi:hypothetical protein
MEVAYSKELSARGLQSPVEPPADVNEVQNLKEVIRAWRELNKEVSDLNAQLREKRKRQKALEEVILRIMKKNTIGALDLTGSGGRIVYRRKTSKGSLNIKCLTDLLAQHLKSEAAASEALKYILENRGATVKESILYEKE